MNIKNKIIASIASVSAISLLTIGIIMYVFISNLITSRVSEVLTTTLNDNVNIMQEWVNGKSTALKMMKDVLITSTPTGVEDPSILLAYKNDPEISALFVAYDDKSLVTEQKLPPGFDPTTRPWFIGAKEKNGLIITDPFIDKSNGKNAISIALPISFDNGNRNGVIAENIGLTSILDKFKEVKFIGDGYIIVMDQKGTFVLHPDEKLLGTNINDIKGLEELSKKVIENESGFEKYNYNNANKIMMWKTVPGTTWKMQTVINADIAYKQKDASLYLTFTIFITTLGLSILIGIIIARSIGKPLKEITESCDIIASGDFSSEISPSLINRKDEVGSLAKGFKKIEESVNRIFKDIQDSIKTIAASSEELSERIKEISIGAQTQAENTGTISDTTLNFKDSMNKVLDNIRNQAAGVEETASSISEISHTANKVSTNADVTRSVSDKAAQASKEGNKQVEESLKSMGEMEIVTKQIEDAVKGINAISEQTNLLALNAAIEAARAGEAGRGFAVVADEVKKLAENSRKFTESIVQLIHDLRTKSGENYKLSSFVGENLKDITEKVLNTNKELQNVSESMKIQDSSIKEISEAINNISTGSSNVEFLVMEEIDRLNETILSIESISAVAQETAHSTEQILKSSMELTEETSKIKNTISKFKIRE